MLLLSGSARVCVQVSTIASHFTKIAVGASITKINGQPAPRTFKEAIPQLKKLPLVRTQAAHCANAATTFFVVFQTTTVMLAAPDR